MCVRQPSVERRKPHLGAVAQQQKYESDVEQSGVEFRRLCDQHGPHHGIEPFADHRPCRHIDQNGAEQRQCDADAAEDEIFPRRFQRLVGAVDANHQHCGEGRHFDRDPHQADIVGDERQIHGEHQHLIHGVIKAHESRRQAADLDLVTDITCAEQTGGEADKSRQHDEHLVEIIHQQVGAGLGLEHEQRNGGQEGEQRRQYVEARSQPIAGQRREQTGSDCRNNENTCERIDHRRSPRKRSSACTSTVSNLSRIRNRKMPMTMKAISTEKATLISTTSGMPLAPVAASTRPFSSDIKPTTWLTALRRVTIIKRPSSTTDSAKARSSRAKGSASAVTRSITTIESATRPMPSSMAGPTPTTVSISRWMPRRTMMRCRAVGMTMALNTSAIIAVR